MKEKFTGKSLPKEKLMDFCLLYNALGDPAEAARRIGITKDPKLEGQRLLNLKSVQKTLLALSSHTDTHHLVRTGLNRLAFGSISDAVKLISDDVSEVDVHSLDLFNVSEIKRVKGGGVEIKFFDRLEALEKLITLEESFSRSATAESFFAALGNSAAESYENAGDDA